MQIKTNAALVIGAAIVMAALVLAFSPLLWTDTWLGANNGFAKPLPAGCSLENKAGPSYQGFLPYAHCPFWVAVP